MRQHNYYVYIMASFSKVLYIGVTNDLIRRVEEHKNEVVEGFSKKYKTKSLVYYEWFIHVSDAITREKQLKNWHRPWKINLIEKDNSGWRDIYSDLLGENFKILKQVQDDKRILK